MLCPGCRVRMSSVEQQGIMAVRCDQCEGIWISAIALERLTAKHVSSRAQVAAPLTDLAQQVLKTDTSREIECSVCGKGMEKTRFHPMIPVQIDRCAACGYVWLDAGEQEVLLHLYRELMESPDAFVQDKREKLRRLNQMHHEMVSQERQSFDRDTQRLESMGRRASNVGLSKDDVVDFVVDLVVLLFDVLASRKK